jgi:hypothetical protein
MRAWKRLGVFSIVAALSGFAANVSAALVAAAFPEPRIYGLLLAGLALVCLRRRRARPGNNCASALEQSALRLASS